MLHSKDEHPAVVTANTLEWYCEGKLHRHSLQPARITPEGGEVFNHGRIRGNITNVRYSEFEETWWATGTNSLHREDKPARIRYSPETQRPILEEWWNQGVRHNPKGPAVREGTKERFFLHGIEYSEKEFWEKVVTVHQNYGATQWLLGHLYHRYGGPAILGDRHTDDDPHRAWFWYGELHRENGPAVEGLIWKDLMVQEGWFIGGKPHREGAPAIICSNGKEYWAHEGTFFSKREYKEKFPVIETSPLGYTWTLRGVLHREGGAAVGSASRIEWRRLGFLHREDGPAVMTPNSKEWYLDGRLHREDGPAVLLPWEKAWFQEGKLHREDGPAIEREDGSVEWWIQGERMPTPLEPTSLRSAWGLTKAKFLLDLLLAPLPHRARGPGRLILPIALHELLERTGAHPKYQVLSSCMLEGALLEGGFASLAWIQENLDCETVLEIERIVNDEGGPGLNPGPPSSS